MRITRAARAFKRRDIRFRMASGQFERYWLDGDCHRTRFYDALSIMFPEGERFFIESVRYWRDKAEGNPKLEAEIAAFIGQEAMHRREHIEYNSRLAAQGMPVEALEHYITYRHDRARARLSKAGLLGMTVVLEHFTAMLADQLLRHPGNLAGADPQMARIWRWHTLEEGEHRSVAFDLYSRVRDKPVQRYFYRCRAMLLITPIFISQVWAFTWALVKADGRQGDWRGWLHLLYSQFISPGPLRRLIPHWCAWFKPGFHPSQHENEALIERYRLEYDDLAAEQAATDALEPDGAAVPPHPTQA
jgi:predicted metal-dependent hydrolase